MAEPCPAICWRRDPSGQLCVRPGGHDSWCLTVDGRTFNDPAPPENVQRIKVAVRGDLHHLIQPVIGHMRLYSEGDHDAPTREQVAGWVDRLRVVLQVADAIGDDHARSMLAGQMGLGLPATSEGEHRWSEWVPGSQGARYRFCVDAACDEGEIQ